jgi:hypothetical protein
MQWNDGDIDLDADELDPDDLDAIDFSAFDLAMEESLKDLDLSFPVPDLSHCHDAETAAAWVKSPRLMIETLTLRLNEILERCEARKFPGTVIQLKPKYIYTDEEKRQSRFTSKMLFLTGVAFILMRSGRIVDTVNLIQPTPFKGEVLVELGKCLHCGDTPEFDRSIKCYKEALIKLAVWIKAKDILNGIEPSVAPRPTKSIPTQLTSIQTLIEAVLFSPNEAESTSDRHGKPRKGRRNAVRDSQWHDWRHINGLTDAQIRDRWDSEHPNDKVPKDNAENGLGVVASAIKREESRRIPGTG